LSENRRTKLTRIGIGYLCPSVLRGMTVDTN
jgi:hypothetical protein